MIPLFIEALTKMLRRDLEGKSAQQKIKKMRGYQPPYYFYYIHLEENGFFFLQNEVKILNTIKAKYLSQGEWLK